MIGMLIGLALTGQGLSQFERDLGFELPEPYIWQSEVTPDEPLLIHCGEVAGEGCPHGDRDHWDYVGSISTPGESAESTIIPQLVELLRQSGWVPLRPRVGETVANFSWVSEDDPDIYSKYLHLDFDQHNSVGTTLHIFPRPLEPKE